MSAHLSVQGNLRKSRSLCEEFVRQADAHGDLAVQAVAHRVYGSFLFRTGDLPRARDQLEGAVALYDQNLHGSLIHEYGHDPKVFGSFYLSQTLTVLGYPVRALTPMRDAIAYAEELKNPYNIACANSVISCLYFIRREPGVSLVHAEAALKIALEQGFQHWQGWARVFIGWARVQECIEKGTLQVASALEKHRTSQGRLYLPLFLGVYAETCMRADRTAEALAAVNEALSIVETNDERWYEAELRRLNAVLLLAGPDGSSDEAENCLTQALDVARSQEAKLWELRTAVTLGRLWQTQGKGQEALDLLGPIYDWFTEGFDTPVLKEARALLDGWS